jgi:hypothetical protein
MSPLIVFASTVPASTVSILISPFTVSAMISPLELATITSSFTELTLMRPFAPRSETDPWTERNEMRPSPPETSILPSTVSTEIGARSPVTLAFVFTPESDSGIHTGTVMRRERLEGGPCRPWVLTFTLVPEVSSSTRDRPDSFASTRTALRFHVPTATSPPYAFT